MATIQGSIHKLVDNSKIMFESMSFVTSGIANKNTTAYKNQRFETYLGPQNVLRGAVRTDASAGPLMTTGRQLDVSIDGAGYIPMTDEKGETVYTRDGGFSVNSEGYIVSRTNHLVGSGIKLPPNYYRVKIEKDGTLKIQKEQTSSFEEIGKIPVVVFKNPEGLEFEEGNFVRATEKSGKPELLLSHAKINQGKLERSNVDPYALINDTIKINGSIISSTRVIKILDEMYRESINLRQ